MNSAKSYEFITMRKPVFNEKFNNHLLESLEILQIFMNERVDHHYINFPIQMNQPVTKPGYLYQR